MQNITLKIQEIDHQKLAQFDQNTNNSLEKLQSKLHKQQDKVHNMYT